jgi:RNA polymerase sigma-70 factor (ECF subfamily)
VSLNTFKDAIWPIRDKLYRFALRIVKNKAEAEDVVQDVLSRLWRTRNNWDRIENLEAWSMRITRNMALDHLRSLKFRRTEEVEQLEQAMGKNRTPLEVVEQEDAMMHIQQLMESLPENQRSVIHLREVEQMSYQEICELLDMPMSQVKTNLFRARNKLKTALLKRESYGISSSKKSD